MSKSHQVIVPDISVRFTDVLHIDSTSTISNQDAISTCEIDVSFGDGATAVTGENKIDKDFQLALSYYSKVS